MLAAVSESVTDSFKLREISLDVLAVVIAYVFVDGV
jgi:hypothetical protein